MKTLRLLPANGERWIECVAAGLSIRKLWNALADVYVFENCAALVVGDERLHLSGWHALQVLIFGRCVVNLGLSTCILFLVSGSKEAFGGKLHRPPHLLYTGRGVEEHLRRRVVLDCAA